MIAFITGSGLYEIPGFVEETRQTHFGKATIMGGEINGTPRLLLSRHGSGHNYLPHQINHRANLLALKEAGATAIVSCSVCGILNADWELGTPLLANDLFFPDNRLGDGTLCTIFIEPGEPGRGHLLAPSLFHSELANRITETMEGLGKTLQRGCYAHVPGPRFNSKAEIQSLKSPGVDFISQTCGPEAVLANELELPYGLIGFGVDYANGVTPTPTPIETLQSNMELAADTFQALIGNLNEPEAGFTFENFIYRFT